MSFAALAGVMAQTIHGCCGLPPDALVRVVADSYIQ
jgi:hypothetical protein